MSDLKFGVQRRDFVYLLVGCVFYGIGIHSFVEPANIAPGGAAGTALLINHLLGAPVGIVTLLINIPLLMLSWKYLSRKFTILTALATTLASLTLDFVVAPVFPVYTGDRLLGSLFGGLVVGVGMALIFLGGMSTGGTDIVGYLLQRKMPHISIGNALLLVDGVILVISIFVYQNIEAALFGLICLYVQTKVIDAILYGGDAGSMAIIVTKHPEEITLRIIRDLDRSATLLPGRGAYSKQQTNVLICAVRKSQFSRLKRIVCEEDPLAFVMVTETSSVYGDGFKSFNEAV